MLRRGGWVPRSIAFVVIELGLGWMGFSYGLNLIFSEPYRRLVTPATLDAIESIAPLQNFGYVLIFGSTCLFIGLACRWPLFASVGHLIMSVVFVALGISFLEVAPLNQTFIVLGLVLHPTMATALARDVGKAAGEKALRK